MSPTALTSKLTDIEITIIKFICQPYTQREIAGLLNLSPSQVANRIQKIYKKLGVNGTANLVRYAVEEGIVSLNKSS